MANFSRKVVLVLLLFCLSPTYIRCSTVKSIYLARVEDPSVPESVCGAVWIGKHTLLTAASCFDQGGKLNLSQLIDTDKNTVRDVTIEETVRGKLINENGVEFKGWIKKKIKGKALTHPLFKRNNDEKKMPLAYDLAVVVVADLGKHLGRYENAKVCSGKDSYKGKKKWVAAVAEKYFNREWELEKMSGHPGLAIISASTCDEMGQWYVVDPKLQFTTKLNVAQEIHQTSPEEWPEIYTCDKPIKPGQFLRKVAIIHPRRYGSPIFHRTTGCVAGIISFAGQEGGKQYLTSTKLVPVSNWINQTQMFLDPEFGSRESALKRMKKEIDLIRPRKFTRQPGTTELDSRVGAMADAFGFTNLKTKKPGEH